MLLTALLAACGPSETGSGSGGSTTTTTTSGAGWSEVHCSEGPAPASVAGFTRFTIDGAIEGPAYAAAGDLNGDGKVDLVIARFGAFEVDMASSKVHLDKGEVTAYLRGDGLNCWEKWPIAAPEEGLYFPNQPSLRDVDGDGDLDVIVAAGFFVCQFAPDTGGACGALAWFENRSGEWDRHDVVPYGDDHFYHEAVLVDFDGDGLSDLVTVGEATDGAKARWFKGTEGGARFAPAPLEMGSGLGSFPNVADIDGDGDLDVAAAEYFVEGESFAWLERTGEPGAGSPAGTWQKHVMDDTSYKSIMLRFVPDLFGDGETRAVGANHVNTNKMPPDPADSGVFVLSPSADPTEPWQKTVISKGIISRPNIGVAVQGAPGVFGAGDVDADGDVDIVVSGDGDPRTFFLEQTSTGEFETHVIEESLGQAGGALVVDLDGDGTNEVIFTGYENDVVYVYTTAE